MSTYKIIILAADGSDPVVDEYTSVTTAGIEDVLVEYSFVMYGGDDLEDGADREDLIFELQNETKMIDDDHAVYTSEGGTATMYRLK